MDKNQVKLDPKLQAAYEKIMGGSSPAAPPVIPEPPKPQEPSPMPQPQIPTLSEPTPPPPMEIPGFPVNPPTQPPDSIQFPESPAPQTFPSQQPSAPQMPEMITINPEPLPIQSSQTPTLVSIPQQTPAAEPPLRRTTESLVPVLAGGVLASTDLEETPGQKIKKEFHIPTPVFIIGGTVFFIIYTIVWMLALNIPLPFTGK